MKVNFDGLRRNATNSMADLYDAIKEAIDMDYIDEDDASEIKEKYNNAARMVTTFNCLYDDSTDGDFNSMSDVDAPYFDEE